MIRSFYNGSGFLMKRSGCNFMAMTVAWLAVTSAGLGQNIPRPPLKPIDPSVGDVNPLSASFRDMRVDLRQPVGFDQVYRVPGREDLLMRSNGALRAVFAQSAYVNTASGPLAVIPAGTVFLIGDHSQTWSSQSPDDDELLLPGQVSSRIRNHQEKFIATPHDSFVDAYRGGVAGSSPAIQSAPRAQRPTQLVPQTPPHAPHAMEDHSESVAPTVANNDAYRQQRIGELIAQAAISAARDAKANPVGG